MSIAALQEFCFMCDEVHIVGSPCNQDRLKAIFGHFEKKQSSIEWLIDQLEVKIGISITKVMLDDIQVAKAMHREEIEEAFKESRKYDMKNLFKHDNAVEYYNKTFK